MANNLGCCLHIYLTLLASLIKVLHIMDWVFWHFSIFNRFRTCVHYSVGLEYIFLIILYNNHQKKIPVTILCYFIFLSCWYSVFAMQLCVVLMSIEMDKKINQRIFTFL